MAEYYITMKMNKEFWFTTNGWTVMISFQLKWIKKKMNKGVFKKFITWLSLPIIYDSYILQIPYKQWILEHCF